MRPNSVWGWMVLVGFIKLTVGTVTTLLGGLGLPPLLTTLASAAIWIGAAEAVLGASILNLGSIPKPVAYGIAIVCAGLIFRTALVSLQEITTILTGSPKAYNTTMSRVADIGDRLANAMKNNDPKLLQAATNSLATILAAADEDAATKILETTMDRIDSLEAAGHTIDTKKYWALLEQARISAREIRQRRDQFSDTGDGWAQRFREVGIHMLAITIGILAIILGIKAKSLGISPKFGLILALTGIGFAIFVNDHLTAEEIRDTVKSPKETGKVVKDLSNWGASTVLEVAKGADNGITEATDDANLTFGQGVGKLLGKAAVFVGDAGVSTGDTFKKEWEQVQGRREKDGFRKSAPKTTPKPPEPKYHIEYRTRSHFVAFIGKAEFNPGNTKEVINAKKWREKGFVAGQDSVVAVGLTEDDYNANLKNIGPQHIGDTMGWRLPDMDLSVVDSGKKITAHWPTTRNDAVRVAFLVERTERYPVQVAD